MRIGSEAPDMAWALPYVERTLRGATTHDRTYEEGVRSEPSSTTEISDADAAPGPLQGSPPDPISSVASAGRIPERRVDDARLQAHRRPAPGISVRAQRAVRGHSERRNSDERAPE